MSCAVFSTFHPCARLKPAPTVSQYALVRSPRSEEHTSELQSQSNLVCRLLLEKKTDRHLPDQPPRGGLFDQRIHLRHAHGASRHSHSSCLRPRAPQRKPPVAVDDQTTGACPTC